MRYQVKFRRRREGKTDYYQRKRLILQRKNKYNTPKWRFVARRTNTRIICQVVWSTIRGDRVKCAADSTELKRFGVDTGLTNYSAAYATGLLCSRRLLRTLDNENKDKEGFNSIEQRFNIVTETTGEYIDIKKEAEKKDVGRPFTCYLDIGVSRPTSGNRLFAAMKGAVDGGIHIPHSDKIFPKVKEVVEKKGAKKGATGGKKEEKKPTGKTSGNPLRDRIFGTHVSNYMDALKNNKEKFKRQFNLWDQCLKKAKVSSIEDLYKKVHSEIRKNPERPKKKERKHTKVTYDKKDANIVIHGERKYRVDRKLTRQQRKKRVEDKIKKYIKERKKKA